MVDVERTSGITLLVNWANTQDHWVRALVGAVLETRRGLSDDVVTEFYELLLREKELSEVKGEPVSVPPIEHDGEPGDQEKALRLTKLSAVANVNALATDQDIDFNTRMTVLYGENGAGKTGYVRILKKIASVRTAEAILPNIGRPGAGAPAASIDYEIGDVPDNCAWAGEEGVPPFTQIDVFDAQGVDLHVDGELTYIYTPSELAVFRHTHDGNSLREDRNAWLHDRCARARNVRESHHRRASAAWPTARARRCAAIRNLGCQAPGG